MSGWVLHIARADRGAALRGLRLIGPSDDTSWSAPMQDGPEGVVEAARSGAAWVVSTMKDAGARLELDAVCADTDGSVCGVVSAPSTDRPILRALIAGDDGEAMGDDEGEDAWSRFPEADATLEIGAVGTPAPTDAGGKARTAVLAVPASAVHLVLDALDSAGVGVGRAVSLWHAVAAGFDPAAKRRQSDLDAEPTTCAIVVPDEARGVLLWVWSQAGRVIASGDLRVRTGAGGEAALARTDAGAPPAARCMPGEHDAARIASDWVAFSLQTGRPPARVIVAGLDVERDAQTRAFASKLASAWPDAPLDAMDHDDAVGVALRALADRPDAPPPTITDDSGDLALVGLTGRPGRWHRAAYAGLGALLAMLGVAVGIGAWRIGGAASAFDDRARDLRSEVRSVLEGVDGELIFSPFPEQELGDRVVEAHRTINPDQTDSAPPEVMPMLERMTLAIGTTGITLTSIEVSAVEVIVRVQVEDVAEHEAMNAALRDLSVGELRWREPQIQDRRGTLAVTYRGEWR